MSEGHPQLESLIDAVSQIESAVERADFLDRNCADDQELRRLIEQRLELSDLKETTFQQPIDSQDETRGLEASDEDRAASLDAGLAVAFDDDTAVFIGGSGHSVLKSLGNTFDHVPQVHLRSDDKDDDEASASYSQGDDSRSPESRYQLQGEIARGGMGAILKGRDTDLGRELAIKVLLDSNKDNPEVIQRFVEEAQIGGQLQHPGIAPVYELGQFADERPFFSMKLVKGETLSKLLSKRQDVTSERPRFIGIFEQICQTMAYAHSRGVIHRDLKPANIMVGAFGEVQVMDWGLAKVLSGGTVDPDQFKTEDNREKSVIQTLRSGVGNDMTGSAGAARSATQMGSVMGTPAYMPPEQALGAVDRLDPRADVFGLGAILCQILTGQPPYTGETGMEIYRQAVAGKLDNAFSLLDNCGADIELIGLAKECLASETKDRLGDAGVLATRVTGYLESVEQKLRDTEMAKADAQIRAEELRLRQKQAFALGAAIVAALLIGLSASLWQMFRAKEAETLAIRETTRATEAEEETAKTLIKVEAERDAKELARKEAEQISTFLTEVFQSADPDRDGREIRVAELLDRATKKLEVELADQPAQRLKLLKTLSDSYFSLGLVPEAIEVDEKVRDYYLQTVGAQHPSTLKAIGDLSVSYHKAGRFQEAIHLLEPTLVTSSSTLGPEHQVTISTLKYLALSYLGAGRLEEAVALGEDSLRISRKVNPTEHPINISLMTNLAQFYRDVGRRDEALELLEEVLPLTRRVMGEQHSATRTVMASLATSYALAGRLNESLELKESLLPVFQRVQGPEHPDTLAHMINLASVYKDVGRFEDAITMSEDALTLFRNGLGADHPNALNGMSVLATAYQLKGQRTHALELRKELLDLTKSTQGDDHPSTLIVMNNLANSYHTTGQRGIALELREQVLSLRLKVLGPDHPDTFSAMGNLAESYRYAGRLDEALALFEQVKENNQNVLGIEHPKTLVAMNDLALAYVAAGRMKDALALQEKVLSLRRKVLGEEHLYTLRAMSNLAASYAMVGRSDEALRLSKIASTLSSRVLGEEHPSTIRAMDRLANIYGNVSKWGEAFELGGKVVKLSRQVLGKDHPKTRSSVAKLALYANGVAWPMVAAPDEEGQYPLAEKAVLVMRKACESSPKNGALLNTFGLALYRVEEWQESVDALALSTQLGFDVPHNWLFIAMSHWHLNQKDKAETWYEKSLDWRTDNQESLRADAELQSFFKEAKKLMGTSDH